MFITYFDFVLFHAPRHARWRDVESYVAVATGSLFAKTVDIPPVLLCVRPFLIPWKSNRWMQVWWRIAVALRMKRVVNC